MPKKLFLTNLQHFELSQFSSNVLIDSWVLVHTLGNQLLLELSVQYIHLILSRYVTDIL